jgi:hypothetical protein
MCFFLYSLYPSGSSTDNRNFTYTRINILAQYLFNFTEKHQIQLCGNKFVYKLEQKSNIHIWHKVTYSNNRDSIKPQAQQKHICVNYNFTWLIFQESLVCCTSSIYEQSPFSWVLFISVMSTWKYSQNYTTHFLHMLYPAIPIADLNLITYIPNMLISYSPLNVIRVTKSWKVWAEYVACIHNFNQKTWRESTWKTKAYLGYY